MIAEEEKVYTFTKNTSIDNEEVYTKKESELTYKEKELLLGNLINEYNNAPNWVQMQFTIEIMESLNRKMKQEALKLIK